MNKVILSGRLTKDPETRVNPANQSEIVTFTIAVNKYNPKTKEKGADFINCVSFGKTAESISKYATKGTMLFIEGRWATSSYKDKEGRMVYQNQCQVSSFEFGSNKGDLTTKNDSASGEKSMDADSWFNVPDGASETGLPFM